MSVLTDIIAGLWIFVTGAAAARFAFEPRKKQVINLHIDSYLNYPKGQDDLNPSDSTGIAREENTMTNIKPKIRVRKRRGDLVHGHPEHWMVEETRQGITFVAHFSTHAEAVQWADQKLRKRLETELANKETQA